MSIYQEAPAADPRALLSAAALGSIAGIVLGGGYFLAAHVASAPSTFVTASTPAFVSPVAAAVALPSRSVIPARAPIAQPSRPQLRWLHFAAPPFRPAAVDASQDRQCLTQAVYYEARGEGAAGQEAVAQVVLNRVRHPAFPKSVCGVVFQRSAEGCQFSFACDGHRDSGRDALAWSRAQTVADRALDGFVMRQVGGATHFHVSNLAVDWSQGLARVAQIGAHVFYGLTGRPDHAFAAHASPLLEARAAPSPEAQPAVAPAIDPRVHLVLASEPVAPPAAAAAALAGPAVATRVEPVLATALTTKAVAVVASPATSVADTH